MTWEYPYGKPLTISIPGAFLGGIEINQNQPPANTDHGITPGFAWYYQQFQLPTNFVRGTDSSSNQIIPQISGIQVKTQIPKHLIGQATLDYILDWQAGDVWTNLAQGLTIGATAYGDEVWFDVVFTAPITVTESMLNATFRFGVRGRQTPPVEQRHKCLPIRQWGGNWYYYNYFKHYGNAFSEYGFNSFYADYPYYEWGYYGFPYFYQYPWWGEYWGDYFGDIYLPWSSPWSGGWAFPYGYYNSTFYDDWYWNYYGYPYAPFNFYQYFGDNYLPLTDSSRWWNNWDDWEYDADTFPIIQFDSGVIPDTLIDLDEETPYPIIFDNNYSYLYKHSEPEFEEQWGFRHQYCLHTQYGLPWLWYSSPNPFVRAENSFVTDGSENAIFQDGGTISFMFRLVTLTADEGVDQLNQKYRSTVVIHGADNLDTLNSQANQNLNWISKPNPSKYAVECLYFDISDADGNPQVFDRIYIDPITTGVYFSVYTSNDGAPGGAISDWESKTWDRVPQTYQLTKTQSYAMPAPITTKYVCIEFTMLQAKAYTAPDLAQPIVYKKHPKWVLDYFLIRTAELHNSGSAFLSGTTAVTYNALNLAYSYYMDDLNQAPSGTPSLTQLQNFFSNNNDTSDQISTTMAGLINIAFKPYTNTPSTSINASGLISLYANAALAQNASYYSTEVNPSSVAPQSSSLVSSLNRDDLVYEASFPVMYFYISCPHTYREVFANFDQGTAYSVGLQQLAFQRQHYTVQFDSASYIERGGDNVNIELNDLVRVDDAWAVYAAPQTS